MNSQNASEFFEFALERNDLLYFGVVLQRQNGVLALNSACLACGTFLAANAVFAIDGP